MEEQLFAFLKEEKPAWWKEAAEVERIVYSDPPSALTKCRKWTEALIHGLMEEERIADVYEKMSERIRKLKRDGILTESVHESMEWIRREGNKAAHQSGYGTVEESLKAHRHLFHLAVWWMEVYGSPDFQAPPYRHPTVDKGVDAAEIERVISRALDEKLSGLEAIMRKQREEAAPAVEKIQPKERMRSDEFVLADYLKDHGLEVIDKRESGGTLWVVGGWELNDVLFPLKERKIYFRFIQKGGRATNRKPAWFLMNKV